jgi:hypothetical protein
VLCKRTEIQLFVLEQIAKHFSMLFTLAVVYDDLKPRMSDGSISDGSALAFHNHPTPCNIELISSKYNSMRHAVTAEQGKDHATI